MRSLYFSVLLFLLPASAAWAAQNARFACGGKVEAEVWALWDTDMRDFLQRRVLQDRLLKQGEGNVLYDFQTYTHNLVSMARRCNRTKRLAEIAALVRTAYDALEPGGMFSPGRRWICRSGSLCDEKSRLRNTEVMLYSVQFLGIASSVANALASSQAPLGEEEKRFLQDTIEIVTEHLLRWGDDSSIDKMRKAMQAKPEDVKSSFSTLFFTDKHLWMITIYAELAGVLDARNRHAAGIVEIEDRVKAQLRTHLSTLLQFFSARISYRRTTDGRLGNIDMADLDRGYWRLYADNRYAGYEKEEKPVACVPSENGKSGFRLEVRVPAKAVAQRQDTGWDISHAHRLVYALDALERNRNALRHVFSLDEKQLPPRELPFAFAGTLVAVLWNGDTNRPLFSNYWSGANGWFRVAYGSENGRCREGFPPYGMTSAFLIGGYITWARYRPVIGVLGKRLYELTSDPDGAESPFIASYYPALARSASAQRKALTRLMFLPSLVGSVDK